MSQQAPSSPEPLNTLKLPLWGSRLIEASAGTGKTYTIAGLYLRLVLGHGELPMPSQLATQQALTPPEILVVTFTRAATQELRDRIRSRLTEGAACFLEELDGDPYLQELRNEYPPEQWSACARRLQLAAEWMDDAAISTIDAWCYRMLREHAFETAGLFDIEMETDDAERVAEATRDYWRLFIAPLGPDDFERIIQTLKSTLADKRISVDCELLAKILRTRWLGKVNQIEDSGSPAETLNKVQGDGASIKAKWRQWAPEMRALLQTAYDEGHYHKKRLKVTTWRGWMDSLEDWANDPVAMFPFKRASDVWDRLCTEGWREIWKTGVPPQHPAFQEIRVLQQQLIRLEATLLGWLPHAARWVASRVEELRRRRGTVGFSGLLKQLDHALHSDAGNELAASIRTQFPVALVDEFQDTSPVQYRIFDRIYNVSKNDRASLLALIGDPKQAIYRFRGADIHAYLAARRDCEGRLYTLARNFRSSPAMVSAVNALFSSAERSNEQGAFLFRKSSDSEASNPVPFVPVTAASEPGTLLIDGEPAPALTVWSETDFEKAASCAAALAEGCASEITRLLNLSQAGRAAIATRNGHAPLKASDFAILVNSRHEAARVRDALNVRGVRSVYLSDDASVFESASAYDVLAWLRACAEPENAWYVRAALATRSLALSWAQLDALVHDDDQWEHELERFAQYREHWRRHGVLPMLRRLMHDFDVPSRLLAQHAQHDGERRLTDLLHLAELLQTATASLDGERALIRYLEENFERSGESDPENDVARMRLESDAGLVQVVTVHKSKGLEYPLVFYPYAYHCRPVDNVEFPAVCRDADGKEQVVAGELDLDPAAVRQLTASLEHERLAEDMRKLYVALTRAKYATWIAIAPVKALPLSAPGYILGGTEACSAEALQHSLAMLAAQAPHITIEPFPATHQDTYAPPEPGTTAATWRTMGRHIVQRWSMSSYSALAKQAVEQSSGMNGDGDAVGFALPDDAGLDTYQEAYAAQGVELTVAGGEPADATGIHAFPKGAEAGSFLHALLEGVFRDSPQTALADEAALRALVLRRCRSRGWEAHAGTVANWLIAFSRQTFRMRVPPDEQPDLVLSELSFYLQEMEFWFSVKSAELARLDHIVQQHFLPGMRRPSLETGRFNGLLRGFVDLAFEHGGRYYVADYKSNWLGPDASAYQPETMIRSILMHRYDLQSALYLYALHRHLSARLGDDYDYNTHVGGAMIFFVRGYMAPGQGMLLERPSEALVESLDLLFHGSAPASA